MLHGGQQQDDADGQGLQGGGEGADLHVEGVGGGQIHLDVLEQFRGCRIAHYTDSQAMSNIIVKGSRWGFGS